MELTETQIKNFLDKITIEEECWKWVGARHYKGYGFVNINCKLYTSHRVSYRLFNGDIPDGLQVCHSCDNPPCVNPDHLFLGTMSDNAKDSVRKGRHALSRIKEFFS